MAEFKLFNFFIIVGVFFWLDRFVRDGVGESMHNPDLRPAVALEEPWKEPYIKTALPHLGHDSDKQSFSRLVSTS